MENGVPVILQNSWLGILLRIAIIFMVTFLCVQISSLVWKRWSKKKAPKIQHRFLYSFFLIFLYMAGIFTAVVQIPGGSDILSKLIASSGFVALGLGLAAQESLGNLINGVVLTLAKPFEVGDRIHLINGNITGFVEDITLRHTVMRTFTGTRIIIPNSTINKDMIENSHYQIGKASAFIDVTITYNSNLPKARQIMAQMIEQHPKYLDVRAKEQMSDPKVKVLVRELGINGVMLRASMWTKDVNENFDACSDVRVAIKEAFDQAGIHITQIPAPSGKPNDGLDYNIV